MILALLIFAGLWAVLIVGIVAFFIGATSLPTPNPEVAERLKEAA